MFAGQPFGRREFTILQAWDRHLRGGARCTLDRIQIDACQAQPASRGQSRQEFLAPYTASIRDTQDVPAVTPVIVLILLRNQYCRPDILVAVKVPNNAVHRQRDIARRYLGGDAASAVAYDVLNLVPLLPQMLIPYAQ